VPSDLELECALANKKAIVRRTCPPKNSIWVPLLMRCVEANERRSGAQAPSSAGISTRCHEALPSPGTKCHTNTSFFWN
jgi:hypothetical protein